VKTQIPGLVKQVFVTEWVRVRKGQPLARIDIAETETARARVDAARAQLRAAEEEGRQTRAHQAKAQVASPLDGVVALRDVNVGDLASDAAAAKPIFRIVDNRLLNLTVAVPSAATLSSWDMQAGKGSVFVVSGDSARLRAVTTGTVGGDQVEITSGLKAGETYAVRGGFTLKDGDRVTVSR